jgi:hypothetical protein
MTITHREGLNQFKSRRVPPQDPFEKTMVLWTFHIKYPHVTGFTYKSLTFAAGENGDLKMLPTGPAPEHLALPLSSISSGSFSDLDPCAVFYIRIAKLVWGILVVTSIPQPLAEASSSFSSASTPDQDSSDDYPEIGANAYEKLPEGGCLFLMVAPNRD